jgi:hypothetical protein
MAQSPVICRAEGLLFNRLQRMAVDEEEDLHECSSCRVRAMGARACRKPVPEARWSARSREHYCLWMGLRSSLIWRPQLGRVNRQRPSEPWTPLHGFAAAWPRAAQVVQLLGPVQLPAGPCKSIAATESNMSVPSACQCSFGWPTPASCLTQASRMMFRLATLSRHLSLL